MSAQGDLQIKNNSFHAIDHVRNLRNSLIKDFLDERNLQVYVQQRFNVHQLSAVKLAFIKKDLKELLISPVNLSLYQPIIEDIEKENSARLAEQNEELFYNEINAVIKKSLYLPEQD